MSVTARETHAEEICVCVFTEGFLTVFRASSAVSSATAAITTVGTTIIIVSTIQIFCPSSKGHHQKPLLSLLDGEQLGNSTFMCRRK